MPDAGLIKKNVCWSVAFQIVTIISGFIIPRILIETFGSETNGLIASINQFLNYVTLLEGGVSAVATAALYKPIQQKNEDQINETVSAIQRFYFRLVMICAILTLVVAISYQCFVESSYSRNYVFLLTLVLGGKLIIQYCLSTSLRILLRADQKVYYISAIGFATTIVHLFVVLICVKLIPDILVVYFISGLTYLISPCFYIIYVRQHYRISIKNRGKATLPQKWDAFGQNLAGFIHVNTDIVLLTAFSTLPNVSVYSVYLMIAGALNGLVNTVSAAIIPSMGNVLARDSVEDSNQVFDLYEFVIVMIAFIFYTCAIELIVPFISVYSKGIEDANYIQPVFGTLILVAEMVYCIRDPYVMIAYSAGHFRQTAFYAYLEAGSNILISILLVQHFGLTGVAIGTLWAMTVRMIQHVFYLKKAILYRPISLFFRKVCLYFFLAVVAVLISRVIVPMRMQSYFEWLFYAVLMFLITTGLFYVGNSLFYQREMKMVLRKIWFNH